MGIGQRAGLRFIKGQCIRVKAPIVIIMITEKNLFLRRVAQMKNFFHSTISYQSLLQLHMLYAAFFLTFFPMLETL